MNAKERERDEARNKLRELLKPGDVVYTTSRHTSTSGMMRVIDLFIYRDNEPQRITWDVCKATGFAYNNKHEGCRVDGCGMDAGFEVVYNLGCALWPNGYTCTGKGCRSNDHSNGDRDYTPHTHRESGYALKQRWQ